MQQCLNSKIMHIYAKLTNNVRLVPLHILNLAFKVKGVLTGFAVSSKTRKTTRIEARFRKRGCEAIV